MRIFQTLAILVFTTLVSSAPAFACSCSVGGISVSEYLNGNVVFFGQVTHSRYVKDRDERPMPAYENGAALTAETTYEVIADFGPFSTPSISVWHNSVGTSCRIQPAMGSKKLVVASPLDVEKGSLQLGFCSGRAVPYISMITYLETGDDIYVPDRRACIRQNKTKIVTEQNCEFWDKDEIENRARAYTDWVRKTEINNTP